MPHGLLGMAERKVLPCGVLMRTRWPGSGSSLHISLKPTSLTGPSYSLSFIKPHGVYEEKQRLLNISPTSFYPGLRNVSFLGASWIYEDEMHSEHVLCM